MFAYSKSLRFVAAALVALAVQGQGTRAAEPYVIPVIVELTGPNAYAGSTYRDTLEVFQRYANQTGGIGGRPLQFNFLDDGSSPQVAVQLATQVLAQHPAVVIGGTQTATCAAVAPLMTNGPLDFCISPAFQPPLKSFVFATSASLSDIVASHLRFAHLMGWHRIATINSTDATGQVSEKTYAAVEALPENHDLTFLPVEHLNVGDLTADAQASRIKAEHPDIIVSSSAGPAFGTVLRSLHDAGVDVPFMASAANLDAKLLAQYRPFMPHTIYFNSVLFYARDRIKPGPQRTAIDAFYNAFKGGPQVMTPGSGFAWDPALIVVSALRKLGSGATAEQLHDYIDNLRNFPAASGTYDFTRGDQHGLTDAAVIFLTYNPADNSFVPATTGGGVPIKR
ncbi:MAG: ABC transporter substrate-binding protein [Candidatus Lustribacter sp.]|jgi:branched-chain amino acid transport system substrate-binding protein